MSEFKKVVIVVHCSLWSTNIFTRILGGQWRHEIVIYGYELTIHFHEWLFCDVTDRLLFVCGYYIRVDPAKCIKNEHPRPRTNGRVSIQQLLNKYSSVGWDLVQSYCFIFIEYTPWVYWSSELLIIKFFTRVDGRSDLASKSVH